MVKEQVAVLPDASVTVQTTVVTPFGNTAPVRVDVPLKLFAIVDPGQLSLKPVGLNSVPTAVYVHTPGLVLRIWFAGQEMVGS